MSTNSVTHEEKHQMDEYHSPDDDDYDPLFAIFHSELIREMGIELADIQEERDYD